MVRTTRDNRYACYQQMIQRCTNKNNKDYYNYGAKGVRVCDEWYDKTKIGRARKGFLQFCNDMGERPRNTSLDRIDNTKGYSKDNCRWATPKEQARNRKASLKTETGESLKDYAERNGITYSALVYRVKSGMSLDDALKKGEHKLNEDVKKKLNGKTLRQLEKESGIPRGTLRYRLAHGWTIEEATSVETDLGNKIKTIRGQEIKEIRKEF